MSLFSLKCVLIVHIRFEFYENVNTNASESLQTSYDHYKCLSINKNDLQLVTNMLRMVTNMLRICFLANFRSMFLIFVKPQNRARMLTKAYEYLAITLRSMRIGREGILKHIC